MNDIAKVAATAPDAQLLEFLFAVQRLHRVVIDLVTDQLAALEIDEINAVQALMLCSIGDATMTIGKLKRNGHYHGSNASHNLKKLVDRGYISPAKHEDDRRSVFVSLTEKGHDLRAQLMQRIGKLSLNSEMRFLFPELAQQIDPICKELEKQIRYFR